MMFIHTNQLTPLPAAVEPPLRGRNETTPAARCRGILDRSRPRPRPAAVEPPLRGRHGTTCIAVLWNPPGALTSAPAPSSIRTTASWP